MSSHGEVEDAKQREALWSQILEIGENGIQSTQWKVESVTFIRVFASIKTAKGLFQLIVSLCD